MMRATSAGRLGVLLLLGVVGGRAGVVSVRVDADGFGASAADIGAVCGSVAECFTAGWQQAEPVKVLVVHGGPGPLTAFHRNEHGETVVRLDTGGTYWSQYAYQFSHELCHVLSGCEDDFKGNLWFEETLCETASLYCMRRMSEQWRSNPPYPNWRDYAPALADYARDVIASRTLFAELVKAGLPAFHRRHQAQLVAEPCDRELNGTMAVLLLSLFEAEPRHWHAVRWLNPAPSPAGETFPAYLKKWHAAAPAEHREFISRLADLYGIRW